MFRDLQLNDPKYRGYTGCQYTTILIAHGAFACTRGLCACQPCHTLLRGLVYGKCIHASAWCMASPFMPGLGVWQAHLCLGLIYDMSWISTVAIAVDRLPSHWHHTYATLATLAHTRMCDAHTRVHVFTTGMDAIQSIGL